MAAKRGLAKLEARVSELEAALEQARSVGAALRRVGMAVGESDELEDLLALIVDTTTMVLDADRATLYLLHGDRLVSRVKQGDELQEIVVELGQGIAGHVAKIGRPLRVKDAYRDARFDAAWDKKSGYRTRSILAVPLKDHLGKTIGVLQVLNKRGGGELFTQYDTEVLNALAMQAAVSLEKANLFQRLRAKNEQLRDATKRLERSLRDLELLYDLETSMSQAETVEEVARSAIALTAGACDAAAGALLHHSSDSELMLYVVSLKKTREVRKVVVQPGEGIAARAMDSGKLLAIDNPKEVRDPRRVRELLGMNVRSAIATPLGAAGPTNDVPPVGALALYNHKGRPSCFSDEDAALLRLVSANVNTELRVVESRRKREQAERLGSIGRLLSGVMHDLRTPLTVISGYVQLMQLADEPTVREQYGGTIKEQFEVIAAMQRDLLAYARGETALLIRKVYLGRFCEGIAKQFQPELSDTSITLVVDVQHNGTAYFDESRLSRAIGNLVRNGIEALEPKGGALTLSCAADGDDLTIAVTDTGPGVPRAIRRRLFEPFVTKGKKLGTGLGLSNVKKIVEEHGGTVDVTSSRAGTTFTVRIPNAMRPHSLRPQTIPPLPPHNTAATVTDPKS